MQSQKNGDGVSRLMTLIEKIAKTLLEENEKRYIENKITIGKYSLDGKLLKEYVRKVAYLRRAVEIGRINEDPIIIQNALIRRENIHRKIYKSIKLHYHSDSKATKESIKFNELLDVWLTNTLSDNDT